MFAFRIWIYEAIFLITFQSIEIIRAIETDEPEASLKPRHFNPHPYLHFSPTNLNNVQYIHPSSAAPVPVRIPNHGIYNQGPVQFPPTDTNEVENERDLQHLPHPYEKLALRSQQKILKTIHSDQGHLAKKHYAFSYTVRDTVSGDDFSHTQQQQNGAVKGSYKVQLPDGRVQVVKYTADNNGYNADVSYIEDHSNGYSSAPNPIQPTSAIPSAQPVYNYYQKAQPQPQIYNRPTPATHYSNAIRQRFNNLANIAGVQINTYNTAPHHNEIFSTAGTPSIVTPTYRNLYSTQATPTPATFQDIYVLSSPRAFVHATAGPVISQKSTNVVGNVNRNRDDYVEFGYQMDHGNYYQNSASSNGNVWIKTNRILKK